MRKTRKGAEHYDKQRSRRVKDAKKCRDTEFRYGTIASKNVI